MNDRIKKLRKALSLTQQEFADRIGISRNNIASYETGRSNLGEAVISLICKEFNVNEIWLRTGKGEMFIELSREDEITSFMENIINSKDRDFWYRFISVLARLNIEEWKVLQKIALNMAEDPKETFQNTDSTLTFEQQAHTEAEQYYREILEEKKAAAESAALRNIESKSKLA